jgi:hypothetical protein
MQGGHDLSKEKLMAEQMRPASPSQAPDPARSYGREKPEAESGMGRLDNNTDATPTNQRDKMHKAVGNRQKPRQVNAHDVVNDRAEPSREQPDHSMLDEEPQGWDQAPLDAHDPTAQRQPRTEGKGGAP